MRMKTLQSIIIVVFVGFIVLISMSAMSETPQDGRYYFDAMKEAMLEILEEHQELINANPDGAVKNKDLEPDAIYKKAYATFKKIVGRGFSLKDLTGETDPEKITPILASLLQGGRNVIAGLQVSINTEADGSVKLKKFIPAVFGRLTIDRFTQKTGVPMKQTTPGRGEYGVRNPYNTPNEWESDALIQFLTPGWELNKGVGVHANGEYRYVKPIYIKKGCLVCHGTPTGELGPYGHPKEGYETGDIRGGISVALPNN